MNLLVDTNVLLYSADPAFAEHEAAHALMDRLRRGDSPWFLTWGIVYEFLRVATHPAVFARPFSIQVATLFMKRLMDSPSLRVLQETDNHLSLLREEVQSLPEIHGNAMHDAHIVVLMREHGIRTILTADRGFRRFKGIEAVDPVHH